MDIIIVLRDNKSGAFLSPAFYPDVRVATRSILMAMDNPELAITKYPEEFDVYEIGKYDSHSGTIQAYEQPVFQVSLMELKTHEQARKARLAQNMEAFKQSAEFQQKLNAGTPSPEAVKDGKNE